MLCLVPVAVRAGSYTFTDTGLTSLAHGAAYTWGLSPTANSTGTTLGSLESAIKGGKNVGAATLTITGLYDWTAEPADVLYVNLLNNLKPGNSSYTYDSSPSQSDTTFGTDVFETLTKPTAPTAPVKPTAPVAPTAPTLTKPTYPAATPASTFAARLATYNAALAAYNAAWATYNTAYATYTANLATYNTNLANYNNTLLPAYNAALAAYNTALKNYNAYANSQASLGFAGVSPTSVPGSIYDQAHSLLVSSTPNGPGTWTDLTGPAGKTNLVITFSGANIALLNSLLKTDPSTTDLGLGFGPDCHFYDTSVTLNVTTVPDNGSTLILVGASLLGLLGLVRLARQLRAA